MVSAKLWQPGNVHGKTVAIITRTGIPTTTMQNLTSQGLIVQDRPQVNQHQPQEHHHKYNMIKFELRHVISNNVVFRQV